MNPGIVLFVSSLLQGIAACGRSKHKVHIYYTGRNSLGAKKARAFRPGFFEFNASSSRVRR
jgi:hypothetical protein